MHQPVDTDAPEYGTLGFRVDGRDILARLVPTRHPDFQVPLHCWERVDGASLWGFCRRFSIMGIKITQFPDIMKMVIEINDQYDSVAYFAIENTEFARFYHELCEQYNETAALDWREVGF